MKRFIRISVPACGGQFVVWWPEPKGPAPKYYGEQDTRASSPVQITFERDDRVIEIHSAADVMATIRAEGCAPARVVAEQLVDFAVMFGFLLDIAGRVVAEAGPFWARPLPARGKPHCTCNWAFT